MIMPNPMCRPPNPAAMSQFPHAPGPNSATAPRSMKQIPITGTMRTENAPPVTNPVPYSSSQVPGSACHRPARYSATVSRPPTTMGGRKLRPNRRPGPDRMGSFTAYAFRTIADPPIASATIASPSQVASHNSGVRWRAARNTAARAVTPTATWPQPGTAVNDPARSIDMEGIAGVVHESQTDPTTPAFAAEYGRFRRLMTAEANAAVEGALAAGATRVLVNDSHWFMRNLLAEELHQAAELVSGDPKPRSMVEGIDGGGFDAALFIGYH